MLQFVDTPAQMPAKQTPERRIENFEELYAPFPLKQAAKQAGRCSQCGVPFCQVGCPLQNNIPDWLKLAAEDRMEEAYQLSASTNNFPEICGRICPQDRLCEVDCVLEISDHSAVTIGVIEKHITEEAWKNDLIKPVVPGTERPESVGIIGAGPAGMAAAEELRKLGYQVHVYDRYDRVGGLLIYGIPNFKLEKEVVKRRTIHLQQSGVQFHLNTDVGRDISFETLCAKHDSVLIANGVYKSRDLKAPGMTLKGIELALDFLTAHNHLCLGDDLDTATHTRFDVTGKHVVVVGGGDTAMDCVRTSIRQDAASVTCLYRRDRLNMPGSPREVRNAEEEGVHFDWLKSPQAFLGKIGDRVEGVRVQQMRLGRPDAQNRCRAEAIEGQVAIRAADMVILALGFEAEAMQKMLEAPTLDLTNWGTVRASVDDGRTSIPGVYAAGDVVRGASLVVWAIRDARFAVASMHRDLQREAKTA
ncbi:MAG: NAD(P)-dependent oxidoreductase [Alphaproteobacteria bacterium]|nr:NAD(P)-dependent oxidoreductase [Alphaproteobacteria bacterium]